jgi:hypothetical protein
MQEKRLLVCLHFLTPNCKQREVNGPAFTKYTTFTASCSTECTLGSRSCHAAACLSMTQCAKFLWGPDCCTSALKPFCFPVKAAAPFLYMPTQFAQGMLWNNHSLSSCIYHSLYICLKAVQRPWTLPICFSKQCLTSTCTSASPETSVDSSIWKGNFGLNLILVSVCFLVSSDLIQFVALMF